MLDRKIALVTGCSRGLGYALSEQLVQEGYVVYAGVRNEKKAPPKTIPILLEMTREKDIVRSVDQILSNEGKIDLVIHNAAEAYWGAADSLTLDEMRHLFEVNVLGPFRLTQLVLPSMRERKSGRILFISSVRAIESCAYMGPYSGSKAALESLVLDLATTNYQWNIFLSVIQPGPMDTNIEIKHGSYFSEDKKNPYLPYGNPQLSIQPVGQVVHAIVEHLRDPNPPFRWQTSPSVRKTVARHLMDPTGMQWCCEQRDWVEKKM